MVIRSISLEIRRTDRAPVSPCGFISPEVWGQPSDYQAIHDWFDESKKLFADYRHRALRHHAEGIFMAESIFGSTITNSDGRQIPTRYVGEQHVREDLGRIPSVEDWFSRIEGERWMRPKPYEVDDDIYEMSTGVRPVQPKQHTP